MYYCAFTSKVSKIGLQNDFSFENLKTKLRFFCFINRFWKAFSAIVAITS